MVEAGRVFLPHDARWLANFEDEVFSFPSGDHDDIVDALTLALGQVAAKREAFNIGVSRPARKFLRI